MNKKRKNKLLLLALLILITIPTTLAFSSLKSGIVGESKNFLETDSSIKYDIIANLDGGSFEVDSKPEFTKMDNGNWIHKYKPVETETTLPTPIKDGYTFKGWIVDDDPTPKPKYSIPAWNKKNINLTAKWVSSDNILVTGKEFNSIVENMPGFNNVTEIRFIKDIPNPNGVNVASVGNIKAHINGNILTVASKKEIYTNKDSSEMFYEFGYVSPISNNQVLQKITLDNFNTSKTINMKSMFAWCKQLTTLDTTKIDTTNAENIGYMFQACVKLTTINVSNWNTSNVTSLRSIFRDCRAVSTLDVSKWNTSNVTDMFRVFDSCENLTELNLNNWDTTKVTNTREMFANCTKLNSSIIISTLNISDYTNMFKGCSSDNNAKFIVKYKDSATKEIARNMVNTKNPEDHVYLYEPSYILMQGPNFEKTISSRPEFNNIRKIRFIKAIPNKNGFDLSEKQDKSIMGYIENDTLTIAANEKIKANKASHNMFYNMNKITDIDFSNFDSSTAINTTMMFGNCNSLTNLNLTNFNTSNVITMDSMFKGCTNLTNLDLSNFNTKNVTNMAMMFWDCNNLINLNLNNFNTSNVTNMTMMFNNCNKLNNLNIKHFDTSKVTNMDAMFEYCTSLSSLDISNFNTNKVTNMNNMFKYCKGLYSINLGTFILNNNVNMSQMFESCQNLSGEITINNPNITNYNYMFTNCSINRDSKFIVKYKDAATKEIARNMVNTKSYNSNIYLYEPAKSGLLPGGEFFNKLTKIPNLNTATEIRFINGTPKTGIDLSLAQNGSITGYVENGIAYIASENIIEFNPDSSGMFAAPRPCLNRLKKISFNNIDTTKVKTMASMFAGPWRDNTWRLEEITGLTLFKTPNLENMSSMFNNCYYLKSADLSSFETSNVNDMQALFAECHSITNIDVSNFNTRKNRYFNAMFSECYNLPNLDLSSFRFDNAEMTGYMLATCNMIKTTITINNPNIRFYDSTLAWSAVEGDAKITVNYTAGCRDMAQTIIDTTEGINDGCYIVLGTQVPDRSPTDKSIFKNTNLTEKITLFFNKFE